MKLFPRLLFCVVIVLFCSLAQAQVFKLSGTVRDAQTHETLPGVSITFFAAGHVSGGITNNEGRFALFCARRPDSVRISMIGYHSLYYRGAGVPVGDTVAISLQQQSVSLGQVSIHPVDAVDIVRRAALKLSLFEPAGDYENESFYREIINDSARYYSVAEAVFEGQFSAQQKSFRLKLLKGRSKEDVAYTKLFENYHPGGGPEDAIAQNIAVRPPDFLTEASLANYSYKLDSIVMKDDSPVYVISFDQRPGIKQALEKGKLYIDADQYFVWKYTAVNSPAGTPYIRSLKGSDKIFARLLNINLVVKGWARSADFTMIGGKLYLSHAKMGYHILYQEPKKAVDLNLSINTELMVTDPARAITAPLSKDEQWKRKNLVANLPVDFDADFWGSSNILNPTEQVRDIISSISKKNHDQAPSAAPGDWAYLNKDLFVAYKSGDSIRLIPLSKCNWEDNQTGGMIYKTLKGDFSISAKLTVKKRSEPNSGPDNGFQQGGIIVRSAVGDGENHLIYALGTGGSGTAKYFVKHTTTGKTKSQADKTGSFSSWLKMEKRGNIISVFKKQDEAGHWIKVEDYQAAWAGADVQAGFSIMARFPGDGPKQHPDIQAIFSDIKIEQL